MARASACFTCVGLRWSLEAAGLVARHGPGIGERITVEGKTHPSLQSAAEAYGVKYGTAWSRYRKKGWTLEQALGIEPAPSKAGRP